LAFSSLSASIKATSLKNLVFPVFLEGAAEAGVVRVTANATQSAIEISFITTDFIVFFLQFQNLNVIGV
jgi:hypothetical protein